VRDPKESISHHNMMISMAALQMFMQLGQTETGSRAVGNVMGDFFGMALHATARQIARVINWTTIARLVDYNFAGVERYPELVPQKILALKFTEVQAALANLAREGLVQADDELEGRLRQELGLPEAGTPRVKPEPRAAVAPAKAGMSDRLMVLYSPDQERDEGGRFTWGAGGQRAERARESHKPATREKQQIADATERELSHGLGMDRTRDNEAFDLRAGRIGVEVKTLIDNRNDKITMHPESLARKEAVARADRLRTYTVVADKRGNSVSYYAAKGLGSFRLGAMEHFNSMAGLRSFLK
jgi:hypothetical protein